MTSHMVRINSRAGIAPRVAIPAMPHIRDLQASRRLRSCIFGIRARPYVYGAPELVELELYLMSRAQGMPVEAPAVRP